MWCSGTVLLLYARMGADQDANSPTASRLRGGAGTGSQSLYERCARRPHPSKTFCGHPRRPEVIEREPGGTTFKKLRAAGRGISSSSEGHSPQSPLDARWEQPDRVVLGCASEARAPKTFASENCVIVFSWSAESFSAVDDDRARVCEGPRRSRQCRDARRVSRAERRHKTHRCPLSLRCAPAAPPPGEPTSRRWRRCEVER